MFCPKCKDEYQEGFYKCANCDMELVSELPKQEEINLEENDNIGDSVEEAADLKAIAVYLNEIDAEVALSFLKANRIAAEIFRDNCGGMNPYISFATGIRLLVREKDAIRAVELLKSMEDLKQQDFDEDKDE